MSEFTFKQFTVLQKKSAMKIGTDSVLLGCMAEVENAQNILDFGINVRTKKQCKY
jgi:tRNA1Val (adenine37-N6)-methyltransferase